MDLPSDLVSHLGHLVESIGAGDGALTGSLAVLTDDLSSAVSSYLGLRLTLVLGEWPVSLTAFGAIDGQRPTTSLRMALSPLDAGFDPESRIVFYAATPGAFVDLAADIEYVQRTSDAPSAVRLDADLPPESLVSGLSGLSEYTTINRALGVLVERGHPLDDARTVLTRGAAENGLALPDYAARLLQR